MDLRYPIGKANLPEKIERSHIEAWIQDVLAAPSALNQAVAGLTKARLDTPYRPDGWTVRQLVHHLPDSHMPTYINFRLALTQDAPVIKSLDVNASTALTDCQTAGVEMSLQLFAALQQRWAALLQTMAFADFERTVQFPNGALRSLATLLGIYAWHGKHHVAHITALRERMGW
ncbi:YfiT family bacillithiol transferase [Alicyclobacillus fodiniaquatilis]|uniref:YfiT family bacillithiol transferase n=1 Tax=Alicyclobacillus fodiniaquatilis TaxID=1661150 RepID=A0ABW4JGG2_9BACL